MKVTTQQVFKLCETIHNLKRLGDSLIKSKDWERETFASCELANSVMNNMTSVDDTVDSELKARIATLEDCIRQVINGFQRELNDVEQTCGEALGYPRYCDDQKAFPGATEEDGVCIGDHVAVSIAAELANRYRVLLARCNQLEDYSRDAWGIIANVSRGNWNEQQPEWQEAAIKWRDRYVVAAARLCQNGGAR